MMKADLLTWIRWGVDCAMTTLIWLVQLIIYPAFAEIDPARFRAWHHRYMRSVSYIVMPLMLVQAGCILIQCLTVPRAEHGLAFAAVITAWGITFIFSVPCHRRLQQDGNLPEWTDRLVATNWIRTLAWTLVLVAGLAARPF